MESTASEYSGSIIKDGNIKATALANTESNFGNFSAGSSIGYLTQNYYSECGEHSVAQSQTSISTNQEAMQQGFQQHQNQSQSLGDMITVFHSNNENKHQYQMILELGQGTTSKVYLGFLNQEPAKPAAIKIFKPEFLTSGDKAMEIFGNEIRALLSLDHPHIVKVYDYGVGGRIILYQASTKSLNILEENLWFLSMEYVSQCTLADLIKENGGQLVEDNAGKFFIQMIETLQYIKTKKISHRDIKIENMLVNENFQLKFADFGFASLSKETETQQMGTPIYVAPEIIEGKEYSGEKVDVFASGVVLFIMLTGRYPFYAATTQDKRYQYLIKGDSQSYWKTFESKIDITQESKDLLINMFAYDPLKRYNLEQIAEHPWYQLMLQQDDQQDVTHDKREREAKPTRAGIPRSNDQYEPYLIQVLHQEPYKNNGQVIKLIGNAKIDEVIEAIEDFFNNEYGKKGIQISKIVNEQSGITKIAGLKFNNNEKGIDFDINFVTYKPQTTESIKKKSSKKSSSTPLDVSLKFNLIKGLLLKYYKYIMLIESLLNDQSFTFYK